MNPHILKIEVIAGSRGLAIDDAQRVLKGMMNGCNSINSHGPSVNLFGEIKPLSQGQKSLANITRDADGQRVNVEYPNGHDFSYPVERVKP